MTITRALWFLLLTILFEAPIWAFALRKQTWWQVIIFIILINGFTHPLLITAHHSLGLNLYMLEIAVALLEGSLLALIWKKNWPKSILWGFLANGFSFGVGLLLSRLGWL